MNVKALTLTAVLVTLTGCAAQNSQMRADAEKRWSEARADVKARLAADRLNSASLDEAASSAREALQLAPERPDLCVLAARIELSRGNDADAERLLIGMGESIAANAEGQYLLGVVWQQRQRWEQAMAHFEAASALAPGELAHLVAVAQSLLQLGRAAEALERLARAETRFGWIPAFQTTLAECQELNGNWSAAAATWARVAQGDKDCAAREREARAVEKALEWSSAAEAYSRALECAGAARADLHTALARCRLELGQFDSARAALRAALDSDHTHVPALRLMAQLLLRQERYREALQVAETLLRAAPDDVAALEMSASLAERCGRRKRAVTLAAQLARIEPANEIAGRILNVDRVVQE